MLLQGKVALVTGGTRGIGRAIVLAFAREGADCSFTFSRNRDLAESLCREVEDMGRRALAVQLDVRYFEGARLLIENVKDTLGRLDILVNNAGITRDRSLMMMTKEDWHDVIDSDLTGVFNTTRAGIVTFMKQGSGTIINISSAGGIHPLPGQTNYAAAKAGVIGFTKSLAKEVARYGVRVNAVAPGFIETDMTTHITGKHRERLLATLPAGRFGTPEEVAAVALFLASEASRYITGEVLQIDGGLGLLG